jgi:hypothetical protein
VSFWSDVATLLEGISNPVAGATDVVSASSSSLGGIFSVFGTFFSDITDHYFWRSLGWLLLGIVLFAFGLLLLLRKPIEQAVGTAAKAVAF